jgi:hypothetical protein
MSLVMLVAACGFLSACSDDPPCQDALIMQMEPRSGEQYGFCRVTLLPYDVDPDNPPAEHPSYDFPNPPVFTQNPWSCPQLDIVAPSKKKHECVANVGPTPTSCFSDGGCFSLLFWDKPATEVKRMLGTGNVNARLECDDLFVSQPVVEPPQPLEVVYCRDPEQGGVER